MRSFPRFYEANAEPDEDLLDMVLRRNPHLAHSKAVNRGNQSFWEDAVKTVMEAPRA